jgi:uncharacterized protein (TIGR00255 family)
MLNGMTGFGKAEKNTPWGRIHLELRSLNHRFLEIVFHLPEHFVALEEDLKNIISGRVRRGRVLCSLNFEPSTNVTSINIGLAKSYVKELRRLKQVLGLKKEEIKLETILSLPGLLSVSGDKRLLEKIAPQIKHLLRQALAKLIYMRQQEGRAIVRDFRRRLGMITKELESIKLRIKKVIAEKRKTFSSPEEFSAFLKDSDISEEVVRMNFHLKNFSSQITKPASDGKELDFIAQELQREINTVSAKSVDALISTSAVKIKSQVEKLREQLQNVE